MKAVVIGAAGHIGTFLVPMLVEAGYEVVAVSRGMSRPYEESPDWEKAAKVKLDRNDGNFTAAVAEMKADVVVDLINFNVAETKKMVAALKETNCSHYLYCSSCWANGRAEILPVNSADGKSGEPLCDYGKDKLASEKFLRAEFEQNGFPATSIRPGQISGAGWDIIGPQGNVSKVPFQKIADGEEIFLPNFGMETIHHVHGSDVAQCFFKAITHRENSLGEIFEVASGGSITLYGYAKMMCEFFGKEAKIGFLPQKEWCEYEGDAKECESTFLHIARSGSYDIEKEKRLLDYQPKHTNVETIKLAVQSYVDRGIVKVGK